MSTFTYVLINSLDNRWEEVDLVIHEAATKTGNIPLYNALCRSAIVLITAHLEGFTKDIAKSIVSDINFYSNFCKAPMAVKRTFCNLYLDTENSNLEKKINLLIKTFDELDIKFISEPFVFENNKNPSPSIIDKVCKNFGVSGFFETLEFSKFDKVFEGEKTFNNLMLNDLKEHILGGIEEYPYALNPLEFDLDVNKQKRSVKRTLWETFLDELLRTRHAIAHGTSLENSLSIEEIIDIKLKTQILQYAITLVLCYSL